MQLRWTGTLDHASGGVVRYGDITKADSRWLRWAMVKAAMVRVHKYDAVMTRAYHRIVEKRGRQVATVAAARKLLTVWYSVMVNRRPYHDQAYETHRGALSQRWTLVRVREPGCGAIVLSELANRRVPFD